MNRMARELPGLFILSGKVKKPAASAAGFSPYRLPFLFQSSIGGR